MTDTLSVSGPDLAAAVDQTVQAAPELGQKPSTALSVAQAGGDAAGNAQAVAHLANVQSHQNAVQRVANAVGSDVDKVFSWFGHTVGHGLLVGAKAVAATANKPLQFVQHEYRYLHDVEATHGVAAALGEGLGIAVGAVGGFLVAGPGGAVLGGEGAAALEGQIAFRDSWDHTTDPNYRDPNTRQLVSIGRDLAHALGIRQGTGMFNDVSGITDGIADLGLDPLGQAGGLVGRAGSLQGSKGLLHSIFPGTALNPDNVDTLYRVLPSFRRAVTQIASMDSGQIARSFPQLTGLFDELGRASTPEEVLRIFKEPAKVNELVSTSRLPTMSLTRSVVRSTGEALANASGPVVGNALQHWSQRLTRLPDAFDQAKGVFTHDFSPEDESGATGIYRMVRMGQTDKVATTVVAHYLSANPAERIGIYRNAVLDTMTAMAHMTPDGAQLLDPDMRKATAEILDHLTNHAEAGGEVYGVDADGHAMPPVFDPETKRHFQAAVTLNQTGRLSFPDYSMMRRVATTMAGGKAYLGRFDDFFYRHVTQGIFKKLVLQSIGYALHISGAEIIPNTLRLGFTKSFMSAYKVGMAKLGYEADRDELNAMQGTIYRLVGEKMPNPKQMERAVKYVAATNGTGVTPALAAGEHLSKEVDTEERTTDLIRKMTGSVPKKTIATKDFTLYGPGDPPALDSWTKWVNEIAHDPPSRQAAERLLTAEARGVSREDALREAQQVTAEHLRTLPQKQLDLYQRAKLNSKGMDGGVHPIDDWALQIAKNVAGATTGADGTIHSDLLNRIVQGTGVRRSELAARDIGERPGVIKGRVVIPDGAGPIDRIARFGFSHVLNPMVNHLSRQWLAFAEFERAYAPLERMVSRGLMTDDEAVTLALSRSSFQGVKFIHNLHDRTQWSTTMRNFAPFYFAQEQAYRRMGRLLAENPGAFRRYQLMISGVHDMTTRTQGPNGSYVTFPGAGWLGRGVPGMFGNLGIASFGGTASASNVIFPFSQGVRPDVGPVAAIPVKELANLFPELGQKYGSAITGSYTMSQPTWQLFLPNTFAQRLVEAVGGNSRSFETSSMDAMQAIEFNQTRQVEAWTKNPAVAAFLSRNPAVAQALKAAPDVISQAQRDYLTSSTGVAFPNLVPASDASVAEKQRFVDMVRNQTRIFYMVRAVLGLVSPLSARVKIEDYGFPAELNADITKAGSVNAGIRMFLEKNPDAKPWTVFKSTNPTGGDLPASKPAEDWVTQNAAIIAAYPYAATWLMPQLKDSKYDPTVYNEQLAQVLRERRTPTQFLDALYSAAGDQVYYSALAQHEANLAAAGKNHAAVEQEYANWQGYTQQLQKIQPTWAANFYSPDRQIRSQQTIQQLTEIFQKHIATDPLIEDVLQNYYEAANEYQAVSSKPNYQALQSKVRKAWEAYVGSPATATTPATGLIAAHPELSVLLNSVFRNALYPIGG